MTYLLLKQYRGPIGFVPPDVRVSVAHSPWLVRILWLTNHRPGATELAQLVYYLQICLQKQQVYRNRKLIARGSGYVVSTILHPDLFVSDHGVGRIVMAGDCVSESVINRISDLCWNQEYWSWSLWCLLFQIHLNIITYRQWLLELKCECYDETFKWRVDSYGLIFFTSACWIITISLLSIFTLTRKVGEIEATHSKDSFTITNTWTRVLNVLR